MSLILTDKQHDRLETLDPTCRVVGVDGDSLLVRHPSGRTVRVRPTGRMSALSRSLLIDLSDRRIDRVAPRLRLENVR